MFYETETNDHGLPFNPVKACVVPRPIGWITTVDGAGSVNAAPFSFFNAVSYNPPFVLFSSGGHPDDGEAKDTVVNVEEVGEFVYNMATWSQRAAMSRTALITDRGIDELEESGLEAEASRLVKPPRIKGAPVHFECVHHQTVVLPANDPSSIHHVIFGRVVGVHIADEVIGDDGLLDVSRIRPIARLGYKDYAWVDAGNTFTMDKHTPEELVGPARQAAE